MTFGGPVNPGLQEGWLFASLDYQGKKRNEIGKGLFEDTNANPGSPQCLTDALTYSLDLNISSLLTAMAML